MPLDLCGSALKKGCQGVFRGASASVTSNAYGES